MNSPIKSPTDAMFILANHKIKKGFQPEALHKYADKQGAPIYWRIRLKHPNGEKWIRPMYQDQNGQYKLGEPPALKGNPKPLYGLALINKHPNAVIFIVEGEHVADHLNRFITDQVEQHTHENYLAITSGSSSSANTADWSPLKGRRCIIWADYDEAGKKYAREVCKLLTINHCNVWMIDATAIGLPDGGDFVDWQQQNPDTKLADILLLPRLSEADIKAYKKGKKQHNANEESAPVKSPIKEIEIWPEAVDLAELLTEIETALKRFIICKPETAITATLWIAMTWFIDVIEVAPLAVITAPEKRCGKTQLLSIFALLVKHPIPASNITPAALFRSINSR